MTDSGKRGGLQRKTPLQRGNSSLSRGKPLGRGKPLSRGKPLQSDPAKGLKRTPMRTSLEKAREQEEKQRERARQRAREAQANRPSGKASTLNRTTAPKSAASGARKRSRPPAMTAAEKRCREVVSARSDGFCEMCGRPGPLEKAHRVARSQGGAWSPANMLDLCHFCHHGNHAAPAVAYEHGWHLRGHVKDPAAVPVVLRKGWRVGWALLDDEGGYEWVDGPAWDETLTQPKE